MTQTLAIFYDAYRDLSARRLFWVTLILSALAIAAFGLLGIRQGQLYFLNFHFDTWPLDAHGLYLYVFSKAVIGFWFTWVAIILALLSTAGIFPDLLTSGTIDLYLARPISRFRFFLTKYLSGLLFATLQIGVFAIGSFLVLGIRGGVWNPALFLAIPLVVCAFSYLFAVCVLFGVLMRSTIGALLLTLLVGGMYTGLFWADEAIFDATIHSGNSAELRSSTSNDPGEQTFHRIQHIIAGTLVPLPKVFPTTRLLDRFMQKRSDVMLELGLDDPPSEGFQMFHRPRVSDEDREEAYRRATGGNAAYTLGSSLIFEAVLVGLAGWVFCRRDY